MDPTDVASWAFRSGLGNSKGPSKVDYRQWDLLKATLDRANGRVMIAERRVIALKKEEDENCARANTNRANNRASMEVGADAKPGMFNM